MGQLLLGWCRGVSQCCAGEKGFGEECWFSSSTVLKDNAIKAVPLLFIGRSFYLTCHRIGSFPDVCIICTQNGSWPDSCESFLLLSFLCQDNYIAIGARAALCKACKCRDKGIKRHALT